MPNSGDLSDKDIRYHFLKQASSDFANSEIKMKHTLRGRSITVGSGATTKIYTAQQIRSLIEYMESDDLTMEEKQFSKNIATKLVDLYQKTRKIFSKHKSFNSCEHIKVKFSEQELFIGKLKEKKLTLTSSPP